MSVVLVVLMLGAAAWVFRAFWQTPGANLGRPGQARVRVEVRFSAVDRRGPGRLYEALESQKLETHGFATTRREGRGDTSSYIMWGDHAPALVASVWAALAQSDVIGDADVYLRQGHQRREVQVFGPGS